MSLRCSQSTLANASGEAWPERNISSVSERLSQVRKRSHEDEVFASVEVVAANSSATCGLRGEVRRRQCPVVEIVLFLLVLVVFLSVLYGNDYPPLESASEQAKRLLETQRRIEEAEFSRQLWADVLRRRLQEQAAINQPNFAAGAAAAREGAEDGQTTGRNGVMAAGLSVSQKDEDSGTASAPTTSPPTLTLSASTSLQSTNTPSDGSALTSSNLFLRVPPKGFSPKKKEDEA